MPDAARINLSEDDAERLIARLPGSRRFWLWLADRYVEIDRGDPPRRNRDGGGTVDHPRTEVPGTDQEEGPHDPA